MKTVTQADYTGIVFKEANEQLFTIHESKPYKKSLVINLLDKGNGKFGLDIYNPKTKKSHSWIDFKSLETAKHYFDKTSLALQEY